MTLAPPEADAAPMTFAFGDTRIAVNTPDRATLLAQVRKRLCAGEGFALATLNLDHLVKLERDAAFRAAYAAQDIVVADGNPVVWLARLARRPVALVPGSDLVVPLARLAAEMDVPVALVGSTPQTLARAREGLRAQVPGLEVALERAPPTGFDPDSDSARAVLEQIAASGARLCLLALGAPKQEALAARGRRLAPGVGFASIGAGLDFIAGTQRRAPDWVRRLALEWLWRLLSDPARLGLRYWRCALILPRHARAAWRLRRGG